MQPASEVITSHDGLLLATEVTGDRPDLLLVHANGFCKETWHPLLEELDGTRAVVLDQRGHGDSGTPEHPFDWWDLGRDVLTVLEGVETGSDLIGVGHSSGGAALVMAEVLAPGTFDRLILAEPIIPPPPFERSEDHPLALMTEKRRASFESPLGAFESYRDRPPFSSWDVRVLRAFVDHGFEWRDGRWALKCSPATEAEFYRTASLHGAWARLDEVRCPVALVFGSDSNASGTADAERLVNRFPAADLTIIDGIGHLIPMEAPDLLAAVVAPAD